MKVLVTGAAGYIASHFISESFTSPLKVVGVDNLSSGLECNIKALQNKQAFSFFKLDLKDLQALDALFARENFDAVLHFAALTKVEESLKQPLKYYEENALCTLNLLKCMQKYSVFKLLFSSTAAVYAGSTKTLVSEDDALGPISVYGRSKLMCEEMIKDYAAARPGFTYLILRYFNVAGFEPSLSLRANKKGEKSSLLLNSLASVAAGVEEYAKIYGDDYDTPDGSAMRDFIHVSDLTHAHLLALKYLEKNEKSQVLNLGYGKAYSVLEVIKCMKEVSNHDFKVRILQKRSGDLAKIAANCARFKSLCDFKPRFDDLRLICKSAYEYALKFN